MEVGRLLEQGLPEAVAVLDLAGVFQWASSRWQNLFGHDPVELVGQDSYGLVHPEDAAFVHEAHAALSSQQDVSVRFRLRGGDGGWQWVDLVGSLDPADNVIVTAIRPIQAGGTAVDMLEAQRLVTSRLQEFDRERQAFFTAVAHRARQPITVVAGVAQLLAEHWQRLDPARVELLVGRLADNAARLRRLIEEVTEAEALGRQARAAVRRPVDLRRLVEQQLATVLPPERRAEVEVPRGCVVVADPRLLEIALRILLDNLVRHTPAQTAVWVRWERHPRGSLITVEDDGPGVAEADRERIFTPFTGLDPEGHDPGLGLGLHTLAEIASVHGGRTWVGDRPGGGASFRLLIPSTAPPARTVRIDAPGSRRILVVDDDPSMRQLLHTVLDAEGYSVATVADGQQALEAIRQSPPDLVIADMLMPNMDGHALTRELRSDPATYATPVIICSALDTDRDRQEVFEVGADALVGKPFEPEHLLDEVRRAMSMQRDTTRQ